jgi:hypothetical protein
MVGAFVTVVERFMDGFSMSTSGGGQVRENGSFSISDVAPGDYLLQARSFSNGSDTGEIANMPVTVNGEDIAGITLVATRGTPIRGRVTFDVPPPGGRVAPNEIGVAAVPLDFSFAAMMFNGAEMREQLNDDWTFELRVMAGPVVVRPVRTPAGYSLKQVFWRGQDVSDTGLTLKGGAISDVEVVLTAQSTTVTGVVSDAEGKPATDYVVVVFAEDSDKWGVQSRHLATAGSDPQGGFVIKQLPPARYLAAAVPFLEDGEHSNPELLERLRSVATPFTLAEGEQKALRLRLVEP